MAACVDFVSVADTASKQCNGRRHTVSGWQVYLKFETFCVRETSSIGICQPFNISFATGAMLHFDQQQR